MLSLYSNNRSLLFSGALLAKDAHELRPYDVRVKFRVHRLPDASLLVVLQNRRGLRMIRAKSFFERGGSVVCAFDERLASDLIAVIAYFEVRSAHHQPWPALAAKTLRGTIVRSQDGQGGR